MKTTRSDSRPGVLLMLLIIGACLMLSGCMVDRPEGRDMPWTQPSHWEGTMPMPGGGSGNSGF